MLNEIPVREIPFKSRKKNEKQIRIPIIKSDQELSPYNIISTNYYLQIMVFILYFANVPEFRISASLPNGVLLAELPFLPTVQAITNLFEHYRAIIDNNSVVSKIEVRGLLPQTIKEVKELDKSNKIDPLIKKLFKTPQPRSNDLNKVRAFILNKNNKHVQNYTLSNLQKYLLWECMRNDEMYGLPIGPLSLDDLEEDSFQNLIQVFDTTYVVGSGNPWFASHLIMNKINQSLIDSCISFF